MQPLAVLPLAMLGGLLGLDVVSFPQAMISRPLVASTLAGTLAGDGVSGLLAGAALELIALETLPFGASRYPEWGSAAVVGGALFASWPTHPPGGMTLAVVAALATAWVGSWSMVRLREWNVRAATRARVAIEGGDPSAVIGLQLRGMTADFLRGALLTAVAFLVFAPLTGMALQRWTLDARVSRAVVVGIASSVMLAASWKVFHATTGARWLLLAGLAIGIAVMALR